MGLVCSGTQPNEATSHLKDNFGEGTGDMMQKLAELLGRVDKVVNGSSSMSHPYLVNLGLIVKQVEQEHRYPRPITSGSQYADLSVMRRATRYAAFASAAYQRGKRAIAEHIGSFDPEDIKFILEDSTGQGVFPSFFVADDPESDEIVLCIQGARTAGDALQEILCSKEPFMGGKVHSAILDKAKFVVRTVQDEMVRISRDSPRKGIAVVGHSLGAGIAILATILLCGDGSPFARFMAARKVKCFAFASPPTFEPLWALPPWVHASTYSFVHNMDCVPRACLGTLGKLLLAVKEVDSMSLSAVQRMLYLRGDYELTQTLPDYVEIPDSQQEALASLFGIGTIILLYRGIDSIIRCENCTPAMTDRLLMHPEMAADHLMASYEKAIDDAFTLLRSQKICC
mmetsp:Transcript_50393/g.157766  ORF Transcript_50393/g.157766 Transcript_50393/m.157766 type:complete len:399 (-) Transcript_50393:97-1293(-)